MESSEENFVFAEIQSGTDDSFEYLFFKYYAELCRYANTMVKNKSEAEEIIQDTFVKLWERRSEITIETSIKSYLYKSVHNQCLNYFDRCKVRDEYSTNYLLENKDMISPVSPEYPIANLLSRELDGLINKAISDLPEQCRNVFVSVRRKEMSYSEAAESLGISVNTVKTQLQRAVAKLREALKEYFPN
jgi:RNA polymerase sigma-70 factor (ECF subfamily)